MGGAIGEGEKESALIDIRRRRRRQHRLARHFRSSSRHFNIKFFCPFRPTHATAAGTSGPDDESRVTPAQATGQEPPPGARGTRDMTNPRPFAKDGDPRPTLPVAETDGHWQDGGWTGDGRGIDGIRKDKDNEIQRLYVGFRSDNLLAAGARIIPTGLKSFNWRTGV
jgi:hypothetical protein